MMMMTLMMTLTSPRLLPSEWGLSSL
jgi:hypothetical protein